jgi:hypothetical protein
LPQASSKINIVWKNKDTLTTNQHTLFQLDTVDPDELRAREALEAEGDFRFFLNNSGYKSHS